MLFFYFKIIYLLLYAAKLVFPLNMCKETGENPFGRTDRGNISIRAFCKKEANFFASWEIINNFASEKTRSNGILHQH